jgi:hypothetical protein
MGSASDALSAAAPFVVGGMLWSDAGGLGSWDWDGWNMLDLRLVKLVGAGWFVMAGDCKVGWCELVVV